MPTISTNKRATFDYEILDKFEAGLMLTGAEVKSIKTGHISLKGAFVTMHNAELWLTNANIPPYPFANLKIGYDPTRSRKLLVKKAEIKSLIGKIHAQGLTLVPLRVYTKKRSTRNTLRPAGLPEMLRVSKQAGRSRSDVDGLIKLEFALAKGKKSFDKRADIGKKEAQRKMQRALKST